MKLNKNTPTPDVTPVEESESSVQLSRAKLIKYYREQNLLVELRAKNVGFHRDIAVAEYQRLEALILMARLQAGPKEEMPEPDKAPVTESDKNLAPKPDRPVMKTV